MLIMLYIEIILIALSLSMDAFSLAISIAASNLEKYKTSSYSVIVGLYHFFMPILGYILKGVIEKVVIFPTKTIFILVIIFIMVGILLDKEKNITGKIIHPLVFGFTVSIDSFSLGITLGKSKLIISCIIFSLISCIFTSIGFKLGNIIKKNIQGYTKVISISILLVVLILELL